MAQVVEGKYGDKKGVSRGGGGGGDDHPQQKAFIGEYGYLWNNTM